MNKEDLLRFTQLHQQLLTENAVYQKQNEELRSELQAVRKEMEVLRQMIMSYGGKNA